MPRGGFSLRDNRPSFGSLSKMSDAVKYGNNAMFRECERPRCKEVDAHPYFTAPLKEVTNKNRQPKWFCDKHKPAEGEVVRPI